jgi:voltage-gated potassium channel
MMAKEELILFSILAIMLLFLSVVGIYYFENTVQPDSFSSIFQSIWWAVSTLTTVGYVLVLVQIHLLNQVLRANSFALTKT